MNVLDKSVIVAAHPDDENLWFSSVLSKVDKIVLCFLPVETKPAWTQGRRASLAEYPLENISCLELEESEVFFGADWDQPVRTEYGLKITENNCSDKSYRNNFEKLRNRLREILKGSENVFTHNPWGEYGHVEHVQVYRAVKSLQREMNFNLWFSNYVSNKSAILMAHEYPLIGPHLGIMHTNKPLAKSIAEIYKRNNCWTWYDDYEWCDEETFIKDIDSVEEKGRHGEMLPLNLIDIGTVQAPQRLSTWRKLALKIKRKVLRILGR